MNEHWHALNQDSRKLDTTNWQHVATIGLHWGLEVHLESVGVVDFCYVVVVLLCFDDACMGHSMGSATMSLERCHHACLGQFVQLVAMVATLHCALS